MINTITESFTNIADAIRDKTGSTDTYTPAEMALAIDNISGGGMELVTNLYSHEYKLADTNYASWTPSTSSSTLIPRGSTVLYTVNVNDIKASSYIIRCKLDANYVYQSGTTTGKGMLVRNVSVCDYMFDFIPGNQGVASSTIITNLNDGNLSIISPTIGQGGSAKSVIAYYNDATNLYGLFYYGTNYSYGATFNLNAPYTTQSGGAQGTSYKFYSPQVNVRCNDSYFSTNYASLVDQNNSKIKISADLYVMSFDRIRSESTELVNVWQNGVTV